MVKDMVTTMTVPMPIFMSEHLGKASEIFDMPKADIVRSVVYDFLVSSGIMKQDKRFDSPDDVIVESE